MSHYEMPHDMAAERAVLGAMLLNPQAAIRGTELLAAEDFYRSAHAAIFGAISHNVLLQEPTDPAAIAIRLGQVITRMGGAPYLHELMSETPVTANLSWYARVVADRAKMRRLVDVGQRITQLGLDPERESDDAASLAVRFVADATANKAGTDPVRWVEIIGPALRAIEDASTSGTTPGLTTGITLLDQMLGGLRGGQMIVVAGRPGMGKSLVAGGWARLATLHSGQPACIFSLEMGRNEIYNRFMSAETGISLARITRGQLTDNDWSQLSRRSGETEDAPLFLDDTAPLHLHDIVNRARRLNANNQLSLVVVDYLQLVMLGGRRNQDINREREVSQVSRSLKLLAKELEVPLVVVAQLNRNVEQRADRRPILSDLRDSGSVEQDADIVVMLHREDYYDANTPRKHELDLIVAKHRAGPSGTVVAITDFAHGRIRDPTA